MIGASFIGLEVAASLRARNVHWIWSRPAEYRWSEFFWALDWHCDPAPPPGPAKCGPSRTIKHQTSVERASVIARCHTDPMADPLPLKRGFIVVVETPQPDGGQLSRRGYLVAAESESSAQAAVAPYQHSGETMYILGAVPTLAFRAIRVRLGVVLPLDD